MPTRTVARDLIRQLVAAYNAKDLEDVAGRYAPDARYWSALTDWKEGIAAIRGHVQELFEHLPDEMMAARALVTDGETVVVEFRSTGTTSGGDEYALDFTEVFTLRGDLIIEARVYLDPEDVEAITG